MTLTRSMGLNLPDPEDWHTLIDRVLAGLAPPTDAPMTKQSSSGEQP
jgi:hypothetical protein